MNQLHALKLCMQPRLVFVNLWSDGENVYTNLEIKLSCKSDGKIHNTTFDTLFSAFNTGLCE